MATLTAPGQLAPARLRSVGAGRRPAVAAALRSARGRTEILTRLGRTVLLMGVTAGLVGWRLGWREFMLAAATCLLLLVIAVMFTLGRMDVDVAVTMKPARVVAGETAAGQVTAINTSLKRLLPLRIELVVGRGVASFDIPMLSGGDNHDELFVIPTRRRAVIPIGPARTLRGDPLGLLRRTLAWRGTTNLYVHPVTTVLEGVGAGFLRDLEGRTTDDTSTSDVELHTLRDYVPGDDRRLVHWRTSARTGRLMVRQFVDTRRSHIAMLQSGQGADYAGESEFELAVSVLASIGVRAVRDQQSIAVMAAGRFIKTTSSVSLLDGTSGIERGSGPALADAAAQMIRRNADATLAVIVTGSETSFPVLRATAARFGPDVKVVVFRAAEDGVSGVREIGSTLVMTLSTLDELPRLVRAVSRP